MTEEDGVAQNTLTIRLRNREYSFHTPDELESWHAANVQAWEWVTTGSGDLAKTASKLRGQAIDKVAHRLASVRAAGGFGAEYVGDDLQEDELDQFKRDLQHIYWNWLLPTDDPRSEFVFRIREQSGPAMAVGALCCWLSLGNPARRDEIRGFVMGIAFDSGLLPDELSGVVDRMLKLQGRCEALTTSCEGHASGALSAIEESTTSAINNLETTRRTFLEHMKLEAPVTYWAARKDAHQKAADWLRDVAILTGCFFLVGLLGLLAAMLFGGKEFSHYELGAFAAIAVLLIWLVRVLVRLFMSNLHLAVDAGERAVLAKTYLSLTKDAKAEPEDRKIMLQALFRHAPSGLVKEMEIAPQGALGAMSKLASG